MWYGSSPRREKNAFFVNFNWLFAVANDRGTQRCHASPTIAHARHLRCFFHIRIVVDVNDNSAVDKVAFVSVVHELLEFIRCHGRVFQ